MYLLKSGVFLLSFLCVNLVKAKIELILSDLGTEKCNSENAKALDAQFYGKYCGGKNSLPTVEWFEKNSETKSYAMTITSKNDSNIITHFLAWNIPSHVNLINHSTNFDELEAVIGLNSFNQANYSMPCLDSFTEKMSSCLLFSLYALKTEHIELSQDADYFELMSYLKSMSRDEKGLLDRLSLYAMIIPKQKIDI
ncbi:phosphatidylethanolamine-binding protein [Plasmodium gonderi]|uniref:Phosphatidylethanolamine-binding protein n=1 Tax=Plasmodium gonderi TaxID=77519 RepID=A0A1Y1JE27_PLAGO|nr:phosphatidylethanolamine-binding protein [Plasmodium gonderi]GAW80779.1 phosphatidylethanolamine-binding protein [Plasmodium gonderi]